MTCAHEHPYYSDAQDALICLDCGRRLTVRYCQVASVEGRGTGPKKPGSRASESGATSEETVSGVTTGPEAPQPVTPTEAAFRLVAESLEQAVVTFERIETHIYNISEILLHERK